MMFFFKSIVKYNDFIYFVCLSVKFFWNKLFFRLVLFLFNFNCTYVITLILFIFFFISLFICFFLRLYSCHRKTLDSRHFIFWVQLPIYLDSYRIVWYRQLHLIVGEPTLLVHIIVLFIIGLIDYIFFLFVSAYRVFCCCCLFILMFYEYLLFIDLLFILRRYYLGISSCYVFILFVILCAIMYSCRLCIFA